MSAGKEACMRTKRGICIDPYMGVSPSPSELTNFSWVVLPAHSSETVAAYIEALREMDVRTIAVLDTNYPRSNLDSACAMGLNPDVWQVGYEPDAHAID